MQYARSGIKSNTLMPGEAPEIIAAIILETPDELIVSAEACRRERQRMVGNSVLSRSQRVQQFVVGAKRFFNPYFNTVDALYEDLTSAVSRGEERGMIPDHAVYGGPLAGPGHADTLTTALAAYQAVYPGDENALLVPDNDMDIINEMTGRLLLLK